MGMTLTAALDRLEAILEALTYTGGAKVFKSVEVTSREDTASLTADRPVGWIRVTSDEPHGNDGGGLRVVGISLEIMVDSTTEHNRGQIQDRARASNAQQGASLSSILAKVVPATYFIDTDSAGQPSTWIRLLPGSGISALPQQVQTGSKTLQYEALCTIS